MVSATHSERGTATYGYDPFGGRVRRTVPDGTVIRYLYDGGDLLMEVDGAGNPLREYTYYPGVDRPHSVRVSATGATYYGCNGLALPELRMRLAERFVRLRLRYRRATPTQSVGASLPSVLTPK